MEREEGIFFRFVVSYGWLFIFLMGCMIILFYFGFLSFGLYGNLMCKISIEFLCREPYSSPNEIGFTIRNQNLLPVELVSVSYQDGECSQTNEYDVMLKVGGEHNVRFTCSEFPHIVEGDINLRYRSPRSGLEHLQKGRIRFFT
ncbi:hypothetical protein GF323_06030 [Candidatus Woesearchaeota archaeon]|nr:hypothetical protein [Candidatus Woesearchaeota archaeon]